MQHRPRLSFWELFSMNFGFLGIQFGFGLQLANMSAIYSKLGADASKIPILWLAGPMTGLLIQPIIGSMSDRTWTWLGRRRPYFLVGAILSSAALFFMPSSSALWVAATMLWVLDASINISMEPFRAFVSDKLPPEQRTTGFVMQSFFIGIGAALANALPSILTHYGITGNAANGIPLAVVWAFKLGAVAFLLAVLVTVFTSKEYPPEDMEAFLAEKRKHRGPKINWLCPIIGAAVGALIILGCHAFFQSPLTTSNMLIWVFIGGAIGCIVGCKFRIKPLFPAIGAIAGALLGVARGALVEHHLTTSHILAGAGIGAAIGFVLSGPEVSTALKEMPKTMKQLAVVQFFTWLGLFCMWMFFGLATAQQIFGTTDAQSPAFDKGSVFGGQTFAWYSIVCFLVAFALPPLAKATSRKTVHSLALILGGLSLLATGFIHGEEAKTLWQCTMIGVGIAWASILSMPYAILSGSLPANRTGVYMGIFNFFIVIPEILASLALEPVVKELFHNAPVKVVMLGGASLLIAAVCTQFVKDESPT